MRDPVLWRCLFNGAEELTVGRIFQLHCEGTLGVPLKPDIKLELPKDISPFALKLLKVTHLSETSFDLQVTSHSAGSFKVPYLRVTDGEVQIDSGELEWTVASVLKEDSQPFPPKGPFALGFPQSFTYMIVIFIGVLLAVATALFFKHRKKAALKADLEKHSSHQNPIRQFELRLRGLRNKMVWSQSLSESEKREVIHDLDAALRVYFLRKLGVSTLKIHRRALVRLIQNHLKISDSKEWTRYLKEIELSMAKPERLDLSSLQQLVEEGSQLIARFENWKVKP